MLWKTIWVFVKEGAKELIKWIFDEICKSREN